MTTPKPPAPASPSVTPEPVSAPPATPARATCEVCGTERPAADIMHACRDGAACCAVLDAADEDDGGDPAVPCTCPEGFHTTGGCDGDE